MQLRPGDLGDHLAGNLAPVYLISGDEPLLIQEAADQVLAAARRQGFTERSVLFAEAAYRWNDLLQDAASMSLFATRRVLDLRVVGASFDRDASEVLRAYAERPPDDTLLLIRCPRLGGDDVKKAWFKALERAGVIVRIWPIEARDLPRWLGARLRRADVTLQADALTVLAERVEGNLAAAVQEIEKLRVSGLPSPIGAEALLAVLEDASHFDTFELVDAVFAGDAARVSRMVASLREEDVSPFALFGALASQLRMLADGRPLFGPRKQLAPGFLRRIGGRDAPERVLAEIALIDAQAKGQIPGDPWWSLEDLLLRLCGVRILPGTSVLAMLRRADL